MSQETNSREQFYQFQVILEIVLEGTSEERLKKKDQKRVNKKTKL